MVFTTKLLFFLTSRTFHRKWEWPRRQEYIDLHSLLVALLSHKETVGQEIGYCKIAHCIISKNVAIENCVKDPVHVSWFAFFPSKYLLCIFRDKALWSWFLYSLSLILFNKIK